MKIKRNNFTNVRFSINTLDIYHYRKEILAALSAVSTEFNGNFLDVGCGSKPYKVFLLENTKIEKYVGLDIENARKYGEDTADIFWTSDGKIPLPSESVHSAMATEVLEHCPDPGATLSEVSRVLAPGSTFFLTVPFLWNLHEVPFDEYRYTPFSLERLLKNAGFEVISVRAHGGWNAALGLIMALWCRRYWRNKIVKFALSAVLLPLIYLLFRTDKRPSTFGEGQLITGISIIAKKVER